MRIHTVARGDTVSALARQFGTTVNQIITANALFEPDRLVVGQSLVIPDATQQVHVVMAGQTLWDIARRYGVTVADILQKNPIISNPDQIRIAQLINVPANGTLGEIIVNGYAYPDTSQDILSEALGHMSWLSVFSYPIRADGSLPDVDDMKVIEAAKARGVDPKLVLTNVGTEGTFNSDLAAAFLHNSAAQVRTLREALQIIRTKGYTGLNVDFEYVYPQDREAYNRFLFQARAVMHTAGYDLTTAVAPKLTAGQQGLLYEAHDYPEHGRYADHIILMTYEWGYRGGPPMAVAPLDQVEKVVRYAASVIPPKKILLGIPNYAYDWTLPFIRGQSRAVVLSNPGAVDLAARVHAQIQYDMSAQSPYFRYYDNQRRQHVVWFEDARSIAAKLHLVYEYGLGGISYWTAGNRFAQNWTVLESLYDIQ